MAVTFFEVMTTCRRCGAKLPTNSPQLEATCANCLSQVPIDMRVWQESVGGFAATVHEFSTDGHERGTVDEPGIHVEWLRGRGAPPCQRCGGATVSHNNVQACQACGASRAWQAPPAWLQSMDPTVAGVISDQPPAARNEKAITVPCNSCGGDLVADGSSRSVACTYCGGTNFLPDHVWRGLNPPQVLQRFWLLVRSYAVDRSLPDRWHFTRKLGIGPFIPFFLGALLGGNGLLAGFFAPLGFAETTTIAFLAISALLIGIGALTILVRAIKDTRLRAQITRSQEVLGRMRFVGHSGDHTKVTVEALDPKNPGHVIGSLGEQKMDKAQFERLGGNGGIIRAWVRGPEARLTHLELAPSPLVES